MIPVAAYGALDDGETNLFHGPREDARPWLPSFAGYAAVEI